MFDTRDPRAAAWEKWNPVDSRSTVTLSDGTTLETWGDAEPAVDGRVACTQHYVFSDGRRLRSTAMMRWCSAEDVRAAVTDADLEVDEIYGGWKREPIGADDGELIVIAHRPS